MSPDRLAKLKKVTAARQLNWVVILENVHDFYNVAAVLRTCDAVGVQHVFVLQTEEKLQYKKLEIGRKTSGGNAKWLDVRYFRDRKACFYEVHKIVDQVYCARLTEDAKSLHELELHGSIGLLFGNEHEGVTDETLAMTAGSFVIPMYGLSQSLNISVACAVSLYAGLREREIRGMYVENSTSSPEQRQALLEEYQRRHEDGHDGQIFPV